METLLFLIIVCTLAGVCFYRYEHPVGRISQGKDWIAKRYKDKYVVSVKNKAEIVAALNDFVVLNKITLGSVNGIGAVNEATLRFFDPATKQYVDKTLTGQMEISAFVGNISTKDGKSYTHYHITLAGRDYEAYGGHLLQAKLSGAGEFFVTSIPCGRLERSFDEQTGLNIYDFEK